MRRPRSLRWRLTLVFTAVAGLTVLTAAAGMLVLIERVIWSPLDATIEEEAESLALVISLGGAEKLAEAVRQIGSERDLGDDKFVWVSTADGQVLAKFGREPPPGGGLFARRTGRFATLETGGRVYRVVGYLADGGIWTEIGVGVSGRTRQLRQARWSIAGAAGVLLTALIVLAQAITGRASNELTRLASELETIEAASLYRRVASRYTTEVDRLAAGLNRLLDRLEAAVGQLQRFTADVAHELRTPIAALRARLEVAIRRPSSPESHLNALIDALEQTERLGRLAEDLLMLSAVEGGMADEPMERVALDELAGEVTGFFNPIADEEGRPFSCRVTGRLCVHGSRRLLKRLLLNLLSNAFQHTPHGAAVRLSLTSQDRTALLTVHDEGPGIAATDVGRVFERFHRGRTVTAGTGLGLALCREIVERHHGKIALHSAPGAGTTATVTLPLAPERHGRF